MQQEKIHSPWHFSDTGQKPPHRRVFVCERTRSHERLVLEQFAAMQYIRREDRGGSLSESIAALNVSSTPQ